MRQVCHTLTRVGSLRWIAIYSLRFKKGEWASLGHSRLLYGSSCCKAKNRRDEKKAEESNSKQNARKQTVSVTRITFQVVYQLSGCVGVILRLSSLFRNNWLGSLLFSNTCGSHKKKKRVGVWLRICCARPKSRRLGGSICESHLVYTNRGLSSNGQRRE